QQQNPFGVALADAREHPEKSDGFGRSTRSGKSQDARHLRSRQGIQRNRGTELEKGGPAAPATLKIKPSRPTSPLPTAACARIHSTARLGASFLQDILSRSVTGQRRQRRKWFASGFGLLLLRFHQDALNRRIDRGLRCLNRLLDWLRPEVPPRDASGTVSGRQRVGRRTAVRHCARSLEGRR